MPAEFSKLERRPFANEGELARLIETIDGCLELGLSPADIGERVTGLAEARLEMRRFEQQEQQRQQRYRNGIS